MTEKESVTGAAGIGPGDADKGTDLRQKVEHPVWCDRSRCSAPEFQPIHEGDASATGPGPQGKRYGEHRSSVLPLGTSISLGEEMGAWLCRIVCPWPTATYLRFGPLNPNGFMMGGSIQIQHEGPGADLYDLIAVGLAEGAAQYPLIYGERFPHLTRVTWAGPHVECAAQHPDYPIICDMVRGHGGPHHFDLAWTEESDA